MFIHPHESSMLQNSTAQTADGDFKVQAPVHHQVLFSAVGLRPRGVLQTISHVFEKPLCVC